MKDLRCGQILTSKNEKDRKIRRVYFLLHREQGDMQPPLYSRSGKEGVQNPVSLSAQRCKLRTGVGVCQDVIVRSDQGSQY